jgi:8-oxo-dGTP diphosphatase
MSSQLCNQHTLAAYAVLFLIKDTKIFLLKRSSKGFGEGLYHFPGGKVEAGETFRQALVREAAEEIGIILKEEDLQLVHVFQKKGTEREFIALVFQPRCWEGEPTNNEPLKVSIAGWFDLNNLPEPMLTTHEEVIRLIKSHVYYSEHNWG